MVSEKYKAYLKSPRGQRSLESQRKIISKTKGAAKKVAIDRYNRDLKASGGQSDDNSNSENKLSAEVQEQPQSQNIQDQSSQLQSKQVENFQDRREISKKIQLTTAEKDFNKEVEEQQLRERRSNEKLQKTEDAFKFIPGLKGDSWLSTFGRKVLATPSKMVIGLGSTLASVGEKAYLTGKGLTVSEDVKSNIKKEVVSAGKKTPRAVRDQYVTIDKETGKASFTPQNVINIGVTAGAVYFTGKSISNQRAATVNTKSIKTLSKTQTTTPKGRNVQTNQVQSFKNLKGQGFKSTTKSSVNIKTGQGSYKTTITNLKTGQVVNTLRGKIIPVAKPRTTVSGEVKTNTIFTKNKGSSIKVQENRQVTDVKTQNINDHSITTRFVDKQVKMTGHKDIVIVKKQILVTKGKTTDFRTIAQAQRPKSFPTTKNFGNSKLLGKNSFSNLFSSKKASSLKTPSNSGITGGFKTDFSTNVKPSVIPELTTTATPSVPLSSTFLSGTPTTPFIPVNFKSNPVTKPQKGISSRYTNKVNNDAKPFIVNKPNTAFFTDPVGRPKTQPIEDTIFSPEIISPSKPITSSKPRSKYSPSEDIFTPTPTPSTTPSFTPKPYIPAPVPYVPFALPLLTKGGGGFGFGISKRRKKSKREKAFKPTLRSSAFNIKGVTSPSAELTGLGERYFKKKK